MASVALIAAASQADRPVVDAVHAARSSRGAVVTTTLLSDEDAIDGTIPDEADEYILVWSEAAAATDEMGEAVRTVLSRWSGDNIRLLLTDEAPPPLGTRDLAMTAAEFLRLTAGDEARAFGEVGTRMGSGHSPDPAPRPQPVGGSQKSDKPAMGARAKAARGGRLWAWLGAILAIAAIASALALFVFRSPVDPGAPPVVVNARPSPSPSPQFPRGLCIGTPEECGIAADAWPPGTIVQVPMAPNVGARSAGAVTRRGTGTGPAPADPADPAAQITANVRACPDGTVVRADASCPQPAGSPLPMIAAAAGGAAVGIGFATLFFLRRRRRRRYQGDAATPSEVARAQEMAQTLSQSISAARADGDEPISDVFISYAWADDAVVGPLADAIEAAGYRVWRDRSSAPEIGRFAAKIVRAIRSSRVVVVMGSERAFQSDHVVREVNVAGKRGKPFIVVRLDGSEEPAELEYFLAGFPRLPAGAPPPPSVREFAEAFRAVCPSGA